MSEAELPHKVSSAGIYAFPGQPMASHALDALIRRHIVVPAHQSQPLSHELVKRADLIIALTSEHKAAILSTFPDAADKTYTLLEYTNHREHERDIADPFGHSPEVYERCAQEIEDALRHLIEKLKSES